MKLLWFSNFIFIHWIFICRGEVLKAWSSESVESIQQQLQPTSFHKVHTNIGSIHLEVSNNLITTQRLYWWAIELSLLQGRFIMLILQNNWYRSEATTLSTPQVISKTDYVNYTNNILWNVDVSTNYKIGDLWYDRQIKSRISEDLNY